MFQLIVGFVGAVVGGYLGGAQGATIGWALGSTLGAVGEMAFADSDTVVTQGPRISDLSIQTSTYGADIPKAYGVVRMAGNVIWAKNLQEKRKIRHLDGDAEFWEYTYYANFAVGLCEGEIQGVTRIFMNGKLWVDLNVSGSTGSGSIQRGDRYTVYPGSETQTVDPTISANLGAANTPAYRGLAYIVFNDVPVQNFGNRIPEVTVELVATGADDDENWVFNIGKNEARITLDKDLNMITTGPGNQISIYDGISNTKLTSWTQTVPGRSSEQIVGIAVRNDNLYTLWQTAGYVQTLCKHNGISSSIKSADTLFTSYYYRPDSLSGWQDLWFIHEDWGNRIYAYDVDDLSGPGFYNEQWNYYPFSAYTSATTVDGDGNMIEISYSGSRDWINRRNGLTGSANGGFNFYAQPPQGIYYERNYDLLILNLSTSQDYNQIRVYDGANTWGGYPGVLKKTGRMSATSLGLDDVVSDICTSAGLVAGDIDVTDLASDAVNGYIKATTMPARRALEPLMAAYQFDAAEIDHKIHFIKRGGTNQATITEDDLSAHMYGENTPEKMDYLRRQEEEVPREMIVIYIDKQRDYQEGAARSIRMSLNNTNINKVEFPLCMTPSEAKQTAEIIHNTAHTERVKISFKTSTEYLYLAPSDPITVDGHKMRIESMSISDGLLQIAGPAESDTNYTSNASSDDPSFDDQTLSNEGPTTYELLDIPILSDHHNNAGFYVAVHGLFSGWAGASMYTGASNISILDVFEQSVMGIAETALGDAEVAVWDTTNSVAIQMDLTADSLTSATSDADVYGHTNWALIGTDGAWEVIAFKTVVDNGDNSYTISNLIRGLKNTEEFTGSHVAYDRFILLENINEITAVNEGHLGRHPMSTEAIGVAQSYKIASLHSDPQEAESFEFINNALGLKPYAPTQVAGTRGGGDIVFTWVRSGRIDNGWDDNRDVPLGEDSESYQIDVHSTQNGTFGSVTNTYTSTSETYTYTAAQQTADFGSGRDPVDITVYQISATVGRGYGRQATI